MLDYHAARVRAYQRCLVYLAALVVFLGVLLVPAVAFAEMPGAQPDTYSPAAVAHCDGGSGYIRTTYYPSGNVAATIPVCYRDDQARPAAQTSNLTEGDRMANTIRDWIGNLVLLGVSLAALAFLFKREVTKFVQWTAVAFGVGIFFYNPWLVPAIAQAIV